MFILQPSHTKGANTKPGKTAQSFLVKWVILIPGKKKKNKKKNKKIKKTLNALSPVLFFLYFLGSFFFGVIIPLSWAGLYDNHIFFVSSKFPAIYEGGPEGACC